MSRTTLLACILAALTVSDAARILIVVPAPSISHQVVFRPIAQELAKRGHDVVIATTDPAFPKGQAPANLTEIDLHDFSYGYWKANFKFNMISGGNDVYAQMTTINDLLVELSIEQIKTKEFQSVLNDKSKPFDLLIVESVARPALVLTHLLKVPAIQMSSLGAQVGNYEGIGAPVRPIFYPPFVSYRTFNLTFWEKLQEYYLYAKFSYNIYRSEANENERIRKAFGPDVPSVRELLNNVHMLFLNLNPIWEGNHPVPPGVVYMGGVHQVPKKELPQDLKSYLDSSTNGVIYMSFGSNVKPSLLPADFLQKFFNVFAKLPFNILWKWDQDELPGKPSNVRIAKWLPQSDLLRHPNVKVFITQCGLQSTDEAITAGVPLIGVPMLADQWYNADKYLIHRIGFRLDMETITEEKLHSAIKALTEDKSYAENVRRLRELMEDQPMKPIERVMWWIEYVLRHGGAKHLRAPAANITWAEYLDLEFFVPFLLAVSTIVLLLSIIMCALVKFLRSLVSPGKVKRS